MKRRSVWRQVLAWLDQHNGAVAAVATVLNVVVAIVYAFFYAGLVAAGSISGEPDAQDVRGHEPTVALD